MYDEKEVDVLCMSGYGLRRVPEELAHDYLWRIHKCVPARGRIGIFNRSYYEDVLVTKVHPSLILRIT